MEDWNQLTVTPNRWWFGRREWSEIIKVFERKLCRRYQFLENIIKTWVSRRALTKIPELRLIFQANKFLEWRYFEDLSPHSLGNERSSIWNFILSKPFQSLWSRVMFVCDAEANLQCHRFCQNKIAPFETNKLVRYRDQANGFIFDPTPVVSRMINMFVAPRATALRSVYEKQVPQRRRML